MEIELYGIEMQDLILNIDNKEILNEVINTQYCIQTE